MARYDTDVSNNQKKAITPAGKRVDLKMLAEYLDLSPATISLVLNQSPLAQSIPAVTRQRVFAAAKKLNYRANPLARSLRMQRTQTIGIIAPEHSEGYFTALMAAIESHLIQAGYLYFTVSHLGKRDLLDEYSRLLMSRQVDGVLLINTHLPEELNIPTVAISSHLPYPSVVNLVLDHDAGAEMTLRHLHELGHKHIAFMRGQPASLDAEPRWNALLKAAQGMGIKVDPKLMLRVDHNSWSPDIGYPIVLDLLQRKTNCSAIVCFNDLAAIGAVRAIADCQLKCPDNISVIGFDDISSAEYCIPRLTTIRQPLQQMGESAAQTLIDRIERADSAAGGTIGFQPELVVRESTGPAPIRSSVSRVAAPK